MVVIREVNSQYVLLKHLLSYPDRSSWRNSEWNSGLACFLSGILRGG